jgi:hypothetical protein
VWTQGVVRSPGQAGRGGRRQGVKNPDKGSRERREPMSIITILIIIILVLLALYLIRRVV